MITIFIPGSASCICIYIYIYTHTHTHEVYCSFVFDQSSLYTSDSEKDWRTQKPNNSSRYTEAATKYKPSYWNGYDPVCPLIFYHFVWSVIFYHFVWPVIFYRLRIRKNRLRKRIVSPIRYGLFTNTHTHTHTPTLGHSHSHTLTLHRWNRLL